MNKKTAALVLAPLAGAGAVAWAFRSQPYTIDDTTGCATVNAAGQLQLALLRPLITLFGGASRKLGFPKLAMRRIETRTIPTAHGDARATFYWPNTATPGPLPVYMNLHGGGFVLGYPQQDDLLCRYLAHHAPCLVVNVDYVLAPEQPFPAAVLQCYAVAKWLADHAAELGVDGRRLAVGGHSAGGSLAAAIALLVRERQEFPLVLQLLDYPSLNLAKPSRQGHVLPHRKQVLTPRMAAFFKHAYVPCPADRHHLLASPLLADDLRDLAPALIITAGLDLLRDEGNEYAEKLRRHGVPVTHREFAEVDHGFTHLGPKEAAHAALALMLSALQQAFAPAGSR